MNNAPDPLEAELSALRPHAISPALRRRVAEHLAEATIAKRPWPRRIVLAGSLVGACVAAIFFAWDVARRAERDPLVAQPQPSQPDDIELSCPTLLQYERALAHSSDELNALLDRDAGIGSRRNVELAQISAFLQSDDQVHALLGEN
jgi:hypothetical protein